MEWDAHGIHNFRLRLGWSAAELARRLNGDVDTVLEWEAGLSLPRAEILTQMRYFNESAEQNSNRLAQLPLAEDLMARRQLSQVTYEMLNSLDFKK